MTDPRDHHEATTTVPVEDGNVVDKRLIDRAYFVVFDHDTSWRFSLPHQGKIILGRGEQADLRLRDGSVSRQHARVELVDGDATIFDLGSHNGVVVNGDRVVGDRALVSRDVVTLGNVTLIFYAEGGTAAASATIAVGAKAGTVRSIDLGGKTVIIADPAMERLYALLEKLAGSDLPILIGGETGTGKELAAAAVHHWSKRASRPMVALNCAAVPENLAESELFGHEKGSFSGAVATKVGLLESARGGTVFLDEIGDLSLAIQAKLLRVLETMKVMRVGDVRERDIDIRIVAATHRDLETESRAGRFREDLYFRLSGATVWLPPLRDRARELPLLAQAFLDAAGKRNNRGRMSLSPVTLEVLGRYRWPGNVRELKNAMEYLSAATPEDVIETRHLPARLAAAVAPAGPAIPGPGESTIDPGPGQAFRPLDEEVRELEKRRMEAALAACEGNQTRAAELIGMPRRTFVAKLKQYGLSPSGPAGKKGDE